MDREIRRDEGQEGDGLSRPRGHLEDALSLCVERPLERLHVPKLLRVDVGVWEEHLQLVDEESHPLCF